MRAYQRTAIAAGLITIFLLAPALAAASAYAAPPVRHLVRPERFFNLTILGKPLATPEQCLRYLERRNPLPLLTVSPRRLIELFYQEALAEGIRPDLAFAQALHETGNFGYGGDVVPLQNNYCGLGTTGGGVKGAWFPSAQTGVRAQIQHLLAYSTRRPPALPVVDPRYELVKKAKHFGQAITWNDLNGKWAVPGRTYGQKIQAIHAAILTGK